MGAFASQGSSSSVTDQIADYSSGSATLQFTESANEVAEGDIITYTSTVTAGACANVSNFLLTDTLPSNVTYVSGGTYNSTNRVVSFPVNLAASETQTYSFSVQVNAGSYFPTVTLFEDNVTGTTVPSATWTTSTSTTANWSVSNTRAYSPPSTYFSDNLDVISEQKLTMTNAIALGATPPPLTFRHWFSTESTYDGGVLEISTNGGTTWTDVRPNIVLGSYTVLMDTSTVLTGRRAWSGNSGTSFIKTKVNLTPYANQSVKFRFRFNSDLGTKLEGWYIDNIAIKNQAVVEMKTNLFNASNVKAASLDTFAIIIPGCANVALSGQPQSQNICAGGNVTFTAANSGSNPSYQWQVSTNGGASFENITGANSASLSLNNVTTSMNNNQYQLIVSNNCPSTVTTTPVTLTVSQPASIITQPSAQQGCSEDAASFIVIADGTNITYQWQVSTDGGLTFSNIPGATTNALDLVNINTDMNGNLYHAVISSCSPNPVVSANATLTVNTSAGILSQPRDTTVCPSSNVTFNADVTGTTLTYQWQESTDGGNSFSDIIGASNATLTINNVTSSMNNNQYRFIVTSTACPATLTSAGATLNITGETVISAQPAATSACPGSDATFSIAAIGAGLTYQWQISTDGGTTYNNISSATAATLTISNVTNAMQGNLYRVKLIGSCSANTLFSDAAALTINTASAITQQPTDATTCLNGDVVFTAAASGNSNSYQWQLSSDNGITYTDINGETNTTLSLTSVTSTMNNNQYRLAASSTPCGTVYSAAAILQVATPVNVSAQPSNTSVCSGNNTTISVTASGTNITYQWQVSTNNGNSFSDISNANGGSLILNNVPATSTNNQYRVIMNVSSCGSDTSDAATLTVLDLPAVTLNATTLVLIPGSTVTLTANTLGGLGSLIWMLNNTQITGQTGSTLNANTSGTYVVTVTDQNGCSNSSSPLIIVDSSLSSSMIRPNPNNGQFTVLIKDLNSTIESFNIIIFDAKGAKVYAKLANNVSKANPYVNVAVGQLSKGQYTVVVFGKDGKQKESGKILIQ